MPKNDPLADALASLGPSGHSSKPKVEILFGDRPAVLDAIRAARARHVSYVSIAKLLTADLQSSGDGGSIGDNAVKKWCEKNGVD